MVSCTDKTTKACVHELFLDSFTTFIYNMQYYSQFTRRQFYLNLHSGIQLSTVVFHILSRRLPLQKCVTLRKIGSHVVFAHSQSGSFCTAIPQSILRITYYAIPQNIDSFTTFIYNMQYCSQFTRRQFYLNVYSGIQLSTVVRLLRPDAEDAA